MKRSNYSLEDALKQTIYRKQPDETFLSLDDGYKYHMVTEPQWTEMLDHIDIGFIEQYLRKKKLEKLNTK